MDTNQKNLIMILKKEPYDVMVSGEKKYEYRINTKYWTSRLFNKDGTPKQFKYVEFSNGYSKNRRQFLVEFKGVEIINEVDEKYSNGLKVKYPYIKNGYYKISLGEIVNNEDIFDKLQDEIRSMTVDQFQNALYDYGLFGESVVDELVWDITKAMCKQRKIELPQ